MAEAFAQLVRVMWSEQYTFVSPVTFREAIARFAPAFRGYDQHDSQEFLAFLLDGLHEDLNYVVHKPPPVEMTPDRENELETLPQQIASVKEWGIYRMRNDSLIVDWFQGQFRNKLTCLTCGKVSLNHVLGNEAIGYLADTRMMMALDFDNVQCLHVPLFAYSAWQRCAQGDAAAVP